MTISVLYSRGCHSHQALLSVRRISTVSTKVYRTKDLEYTIRFIRGYSSLVACGPPPASSTAATLLFMDATRSMMVSGGIFSHSSWMAATISSLLVGFLGRLLSYYLRIDQMCSMGLRSGERGGHSIF